MSPQQNLQPGNNPLPSWNDGKTRQSIIDFVAKVTKEGSPGFVPVADRIATFDNDGTLWCEQPMPVQMDFILRRWVEMAEKDPALAQQQPWKAAAEKDYAWLGNVITKHYNGDDSDIPIVMKGILLSFQQITCDAFAENSAAFLTNESHPVLKRRYCTCAYQPMIELLRYLEANGFTTYIASGGGRDFMRPITEEIYGIPPERVIGSSLSLAFKENGDGGDLIRQAHLDVFDDGAEKPPHIWSRIGKRPIFAAGNSNGDIPMLQFANKPPRPAMRLLVWHDDSAREFAYSSGAEKSLQLANQYGWTVVSMKDDWKTIFPD